MLTTVAGGWRWIPALAILLWSGSLAAQQPGAGPPLNPGQAHLLQTLGGLDGPGLAIAYNEPGGFLAAGCEAGTIRYWDKEITLDVRAGSSAPGMLQAHQGPVTALAWGKARWLASAGIDGKVHLWSMPEGKLSASLPVTAPVRALRMSPDGKVLATAGEDPDIQLWDCTAGKPLGRCGGLSDWVLALEFSPDGKLLASGGYDGVVHLWEMPSGKKLRDIASQAPPAKGAPPLPPNVVTALAFSPDGKLLAIGSSDSNIQLAQVADARLIRAFVGHGSAITSLAYHSSGALLASASRDRTIRLWNPANGQLSKSLEGHSAWVEGVVFIAQETRLASVGADREVRIWDLR
jgi:WD40 repeat protein